MIKQWWHGKVAYQIYPKSFCDSNNDGIGDIPGIISKLDYLQELGIDIVWISPMYKSPFRDQGYDIADYYDIDPIFGNINMMDTLLAEAKKRNIQILLDLVINHCSSEHEWFQKALANPDGEYGKYFYILDGEGDNPPNNWRAYFGGSAWERIPNTNKYYLHSYAVEQPDLNFENPVVREKIYAMINWWLDKGIAGFRIDAIINLKKDLTFKSYPADKEDGTVSLAKMLPHATGITDVLKNLSNATFKPRSALSIAELFYYDSSKLKEYIGEDGCFSTIFDFSTEALGKGKQGWLDRVAPCANEYRDVIFESQRNSSDIELLCNIIENHDEPRGVSHYLADCNADSKKMLAAFTFMLRGIPFLYQGQEIGMENNKFSSIDDIDDLNTINQYYSILNTGKTPDEALSIVAKYSRDNTRTPMHWNSQENAGFTSATPWLKVNKNYVDINVEDQINDPDSLLSFYKKLIALRKDSEYEDVLVYGTLTPIYETTDNVMAFYRENETKKLLVVANNQSNNVILSMREIVHKIVINNMETLEISENNLHLQGYQVIVLEI